MSGGERIVIVAKKPIREYLLEIALIFQEGVTDLVLKGYGGFINRAVDVYNALVSKMGNNIVLENVSIGSDMVRGRSKSYIVIKIKRKY